MACNKDFAASAIRLAKNKLMAKDIPGAKRLASMALSLYPGLEGISPLIEVIDVHVAYAKKVCGEVDWYGVLGVDPSADGGFIRKQFKKLVRVLHPDRIKASYAEEAFNFITEVWSILSDKAKREAYDQKLRLLKSAMGTEYDRPGSFWATCRWCNTYFEYDIIYLNRHLKCLTCSQTFQAVAQPAPPENGRNSLKHVSFSQHPPAHHSPASSVPSDLGANLLQIEKTGTISLSGDSSMGAKNPSGPANSSFWTSFSSSGSSSTGDENSHSASKFEKAAFSHADMSFVSNSGPKTESTSENIQQSSILITEVGKTSRGPAVASFQAAPCDPQNYGHVFSPVPVSGTTSVCSKSNGGEKIHTSLTVQSQGFKSTSGLAIPFQPEYCSPQVLGNGKPDVTKKQNKKGGNSRGELTKKRRAGEGISSFQGQAGIENINASRSCDVRQGNQLNNMNIIMGTDRILVNGSSKSKNPGNFSKMQLRSLLLQKARRDLQKNLNGWSMAAPSFPTPKIDVKKRDSTDIAEGSDATTVKKAKMVNEVIQSVGSNQDQTSSVAASQNIDTKTIDYVTMDVPDPDFYDFDLQRTEESFSENQVWALYDDDDGMPRFYALINSVKSVSPFQIQISRLNSKTSTEIGPMEWITSGFTKTSGDFRIGKHAVTNALSSFSHIAKPRRGPKGIIQIFPGKGETWALYRNWSSRWNELTPEEEVHQYDIVLVLDDYDEKKGVLVAPLIKVAGFRSVFRQHDDSRGIQTIQKEELFQFSHQVPSYTLTGEEAPNAPKGCMQLDPAALPSELLQVIQENVAQEDGISDSAGKSDEYYRNRLERLNFTYSTGKKKIHALHSDNGEEGVEEGQIPY